MENIKPKIRIESDGTPAGTLVTHIETGAVIECDKITFSIEVNGAADVSIEIPGALVEFNAEVKATLNTIHNSEVLKDFPRIS